MTHELILVDDRCPRGSWTEIKRLASRDARVVGVRLSRNFGQHAAIQAGLRRVRGAYIVVMDCDLQDQPEAIPMLYEKALEGWDVVQARRAKRESDPLYRRLSSRAFYIILGFLTNTEQSPEVANFGIYSRKVIDTITSWNEEAKYFPAIVQWVGFSRTGIEVDHGARFEGKSSYSLSRLTQLALDVVVGFSDRPLRLLTFAGFIIAFVSFIVIAIVGALHLAGRLTVKGWASLELSLWFLSGCTMFALGLTGLYVGRILLETKGRPNYIIDEVCCGEEPVPAKSTMPMAAET